MLNQTQRPCVLSQHCLMLDQTQRPCVTLPFRNIWSNTGTASSTTYTGKRKMIQVHLNRMLDHGVGHDWCIMTFVKGNIYIQVYRSYILVPIKIHIHMQAPCSTRPRGLIYTWKQDFQVILKLHWDAVTPDMSLDQDPKTLGKMSYIHILISIIRFKVETKTCLCKNSLYLICLRLLVVLRSIRIWATH